MKIKSLQHSVFSLFFGCCFFSSAAQPYAPAAGQPGSSAMHKDSSVFVNWAIGCTVQRGYQDISNAALGNATVGDSTMATGKALTNAIVSLGDGGIATCTFKNPITNGPGFDFAVFENGFNDTFLELAFVEVSSDGVNFVRFKAHSLSDTLVQFDNAAVMDATKLNNLAGKYRAAYGTPFDLQELSAASNLDINAVTHVRIRDVVGSLQRMYATFDAYGNKINDPWSTPFPSGGFDLDAVGVIHETALTGIVKAEKEKSAGIFPNPVSRGEFIHIGGVMETPIYELRDACGKIVAAGKGKSVGTVSLDAGIYILNVTGEQGFLIKKIVIRD